jgi:two-component system, LytTR family, response regulator
MPRALIIDDEPLACVDLRARLMAHPEVAIAGEAHTLADARAALAKDNYDVVFLDVQLRGGSGFDLLPNVQPTARIVFVTGYDRFALRAFEVNALDYLLKPVDSARLAETIRRLAPEARATTTAPEPPPQILRLDDSVMLRTDNDAARFVRVRELAVIFSNENYTELRLTDTKRFVVRRALKAWEQQLPSRDFMRVHRTALVNLHAVQRAAHHDREVTHLFVQGAPEPVRARRELWADLEQRLTGLGRKLA